jgi:hypothetical protein
MEWRRRDILKAMLLLAVAWVLVVIGVSHWQRRASPPREPKLIHYPGTESVTEQVVPNLGYRKYWFHLDEEYPSTSVYRFYRKALAAEGWRFAWGEEPRWERRMEKGKAQDLFMAGWVSRDGLFEITLQLLSTVKVTSDDGDVISEERAPGMDVYVTMRRVLVPWGFGEEKPNAGPQVPPVPGAVER